MDNDNNQLNGGIDHVAKEQSSDLLNIKLSTIISTSVEHVGARQVQHHVMLVMVCYAFTHSLGSRSRVTCILT